MTAAQITGLIIALGPTALELIPQLAAVWEKEKLTADEITAMCAPAKNSVDRYIVEARSRLAAYAPTHAR